MSKEFTISPRFSPTIFDPCANSVLLRAHLCTAAVDSMRRKPCVRKCSREREGLYNGNVQQNPLCAASCHLRIFTSLPGFHLRLFIKALHGRLAGRFKPPLAGRCNDFAPSRQKNCHRQKQPSRPDPRKKNKNTAPSRPVEKKKMPPRPASEKKTTAPSRLGKKKNAPSRLEQKKPPPRPAMNSKIRRPEGRNWKQIPPPVSFSLFLVAHLYRIVV